MTILEQRLERAKRIHKNLSEAAKDAETEGWSKGFCANIHRYADLAAQDVKRLEKQMGANNAR